MRMDELLEVIDEVIHYLENNRRAAADALFPTSTEGYRQEWRERSAYRFWSTLDLAHRNRLVRLAREHYADLRGGAGTPSQRIGEEVAMQVGRAERWLTRATKLDGLAREDVLHQALAAVRLAQTTLKEGK